MYARTVGTVSIRGCDAKQYRGLFKMRMMLVDVDVDVEVDDH